MKGVTKPAIAFTAALLATTLWAHPGAAAEGTERVATRNANPETAATATETARRAPNVRYVPPPELFDKAFRAASARRHAEDIAALTQALRDLGPNVDPAEAARAARAAYTYVDQLVEEYEIENRPLIHNTKVNTGLKPRGLCWHWADDLDIRLQMENFRTLKIFRAIANYDTARLEHSTALLGVPGGRMEDAIVLDPWREGGELVWRIAHEDRRYNWTPRDEVFAYKRRMEERGTRRRAWYEGGRNDR